MEFKVGDTVRNKRTGDIGTVCSLNQTATVQMVRVNFSNGYKNLSPNALELVVQESDMYDHFRSGWFDSYLRFRQLLTHTRIGGNLTNIVYSMKYGDVDFLPHQFKPVFKFLTANTQRLLIADEVGLGKTIEALYIWRELQARNDARRLLVVVPSALTDKWFNDMTNHFGMNAVIADSAEIDKSCRLALADQSRTFELVVSIQSLRYRKGLPAGSSLYKLHNLFESERSKNRKLFDLVVIDEAHSLCNSSSNNYKLAETLRDLSDNLVLLSATPVNNSNKDLFNLLSLMAPREFRDEKHFGFLFEDNRNAVRLSNLFESHPSDIKGTVKQAGHILDSILQSRSFCRDSFFRTLHKDLERALNSDDLRREAYDKITSRFFYDSYFTRSRKRDVMKTTIRSAQTAAFSLSSEEQGIYDTCTEWIKERMGQSSLEFNDNEKKLFPFVLMSRQRELDSSIPAAIERWRSALSGRPISYCLDNDALNDDIEDSSESSVTESSKLQSIPDVCLDISDEDLRWLVKKDSKYNEFVKAVRFQLSQNDEPEAAYKLIVFSFFRATLEYLYRRLTYDSFNVIMINGSMSRDEKTAAIKEFRESDDVQILLSSEVGAEGLDMQFANTEINYDLPWNPMRLEQRIGRIDRIGQKSEKIYIINLFCTDTISDRIRQALYDKIQIFTDSIGSIEDIMGKTFQKIEESLLSSELTDEQKEKAANDDIDRLCVDVLAKRKLEESAGISKAYSDRILEYVGKAEGNNRYIRREDLINYLIDFCENEGHGSRFIQDRKDRNIWHFIFSANDRARFQNFAEANNLESGFSSLPDIECTFPQGLRSSARCNMDVNHPLMKWIFNIVDKETFSKNYNHCYCMSLSRSDADSNRFPENAYVFCISQIEYYGLKKKQKELLCFACGAETKTIMNRDDSENLIGQVLFNGRNTMNFSSLVSASGQDGLNEAMEYCRKRMDSHVGEMQESFEEENEDLRNLMTAKVEEFYDEQIARIQETINRLIAENAKDYIIKGQRTNLLKQQNSKAEEISKIQMESQPFLSSNDVAIGVIFIE